jgi:hypothetical protein
MAWFETVRYSTFDLLFTDYKTYSNVSSATDTMLPKMTAASDKSAQG